MNFLDFAQELGIEADKLLADLISRVISACRDHGVEKREECVRDFVTLAEWAKRCVEGQNGMSLQGRERLAEIRDLSSKLTQKFSELSAEEWDDLNSRNLSVLDLEHNFSDALAVAAQRVAGYRTQREVVIEVAKRFVLLCHEYRIPVKWSKNLHSCSENCSARILGAIFEAGGLLFARDGLQRTAADAANHCFSKLTKGFSWELHYEPMEYSEFAVVYLDRIVRESNIGRLPRFGNR